MTATKRLRELLDERGVEWGNIRSDGSESDYITEWQFEDNQGEAIAVEWSVGSGLSVKTHRYHLTPEQAIAATLGARTLTAEQVSNATYAHSIHADCADADWQAIADELNATLGAGQAADEWGEGFRAGCDAANKASEESVEHYKAENAKLRELVRDMNECLEHCKLVCKHCKFQGVDCQWFKFIDRMCELGIEVDG